MPKLTSAPTATEFASAWTRQFAGAVRKAAGDDGRLTLAQANKLAESRGPTALWADNAIGYLTAKGQDSVSAEKLIKAGYNYAYRNAAKVAGRGGRVSMVEARMMAKDLNADFTYLRTGKIQGTPQAAQVQDLAQSVAKAAKGLMWISEGDYPYKAFALASPEGGDMAAAVAKSFGYDKPAMVQDSAEMFEMYTSPDGIGLPASERAQFREVQKLMESNLSDIQVVFVEDEDVVLGHVVIAGRTEDGDIAGLVSRRVWT